MTRNKSKFKRKKSKRGKSAVGSGQREDKSKFKRKKSKRGKYPVGKGLRGRKIDSRFRYRRRTPKEKRHGQKLCFFQRHTVAMLTKLGERGCLIQEDTAEYESEVNDNGS